MSSINLIKGQKLDLTKGVSLKNIKVALGWDAQANNGDEFDLDASVFCCNEKGKSINDTDFIFYKNLSHPSGAIIHTGDDLTGEKDGDDEVIIVNLYEIPPSISILDFVVTIYDAEDRRQNFGQVNNAYVRLLDMDKNDKELLRFDLGEDFSLETGVSVCKIYRKDKEWKFEAVGAGYNNGLFGFVKDHGLDA